MAYEHFVSYSSKVGNWILDFYIYYIFFLSVSGWLKLHPTVNGERRTYYQIKFNVVLRVLISFLLIF